MNLYEYTVYIIGLNINYLSDYYHVLKSGTRDVQACVD